MALEYRKFKLVNGNGYEYTLTEHENKVYANDPKGLGYTKTLSVLRLGDENLLTYSIVNLDVINFEILFYDDTLADKYQKYIDFVNFLSYKPLYLLYQRPNSFKWYRRRVDSLSLQKTEVQRDSMLHCPFQLQTLGFWEDNESNVIETDNALSTGKIYPIEYPITYGSTSLSNIPMISEGLLESPLLITINGTVTDPQYVLYDVNENVYGRGKFIGTFDYVSINSRETEQYVQLIRNGLEVDNPLGYQDLTIGSPNEIYVTFLKLKTGRSKLRFIVDDGFDGTIRVEWRNRYVTI